MSAPNGTVETLRPCAMCGRSSRHVVSLWDADTQTDAGKKFFCDEHTPSFLRDPSSSASAQEGLTATEIAREIGARCPAEHGGIYKRGWVECATAIATALLGYTRPSPAAGEPDPTDTLEIQRAYSDGLEARIRELEAALSTRPSPVAGEWDFQRLVNAYFGEPTDVNDIDPDGDDAARLERIAALASSPSPGGGTEAGQFFDTFEKATELLADSGSAGAAARCPICEWPMAETREQGCVPGDCSYRPDPHTAEYERIKRNRERLAAGAASPGGPRADIREMLPNGEDGGPVETVCPGGPSDWPSDIDIRGAAELLRQWAETLEIPSGSFVNRDLRLAADLIDHLANRPSMNWKLPCDVRLPPATIFRVGCKLETMIASMQRRAGKSEQYTTFAAAPSAGAPSGEKMRELLQSFVDEVDQIDNRIDRYVFPGQKLYEAARAALATGEKGND